MSSLCLSSVKTNYSDFYNYIIEEAKNKSRTIPSIFYNNNIMWKLNTNVPKELYNILHMKDYQKLRIVNDFLEIDTRNYKSIRRFLSRDSRWKVLEYFRTLLIKYKENPSIKYFINKLCNTTYKNDKKWITDIKKERN